MRKQSIKVLCDPESYTEKVIPFSVFYLFSPWVKERVLFFVLSKSSVTLIFMVLS